MQLKFIVWTQRASSEPTHSLTHTLAQSTKHGHLAHFICIGCLRPISSGCDEVALGHLRAKGTKWSLESWMTCASCYCCCCCWCCCCCCCWLLFVVCCYCCCCRRRSRRCYCFCRYGEEPKRKQVGRSLSCRHLAGLVDIAQRRALAIQEAPTKTPGHST